MAFGLDDALGIGNFGAGLLDTAVSAFSADKANEANIKLARENREFQQYSAQHQYQWAVDDMKKAGINPMLAYMKGGPGELGGSVANVQPVLKPGTSGKDSFNSLLQQRLMKAQIDNVEQDTKKKLEDTYVSQHTGANLMKQWDILDSTATSARAQARADQIREKFLDTPAGELLRKIDLIGKSLNPFASATSSARSALR